MIPRRTNIENAQASGLDARERDELAEILLRLLNSFLADPGPERSEDELRRFLFRWLVPLIEEKLPRSGRRRASSE